MNIDNPIKHPLRGSLIIITKTIWKVPKLLRNYSKYETSVFNHSKIMAKFKV